jgi:ABC-type antimicrobial peptide transport system permease subunit
MLDRREEPNPAMYFQALFASSLTLAVRTTGDPVLLAGALREVVKRIDPVQPVSNLRTLDEILEGDGERSRLQTTFLTTFAGLALLLGIVGIAGVVAYTVERRAPELALRLALGATPRQAIRSAAQGGLTASSIGIALGLFAAWGLSQWFAAVLYGVRPDDPRTFAIAGTALLAFAAAACWLPARRAVRIDPATALKQE